MSKDATNIVVSVQAKDFAAGEAGNDGVSPEYANLTVTYGTAVGHVEWLADLPSAGHYYLHAQMTSAQNRPCVLSINGVRQDKPILGEITGGWQADTLQWFVYGPYEFKQGANLFGIHFTQYQPHLKAFGFAPAEAAHSAKAGLSAHDSLVKLKEGYQRFAAGQPQVNPARLWAEIKDNAKGQRPFAIVLACADSRVPPEIIFDQDVGDLFVVRVAGNVADTGILGSIQYAVEHLGTKLIVVLGHERCGAIQAALSVADGKGAFAGPLGQLVSAVVPLVEPVYRRGRLAKPPLADAAVLDEAVRVNVKRQIALIRDALENLGQEKLTLELWLKQVLVVGARYDLDDGTVEFFNEPVDSRPKRVGLIAANGLGVAVQPNGALAVLAGQDFDDFELHEAGEGRFALKSAGGKFVSASADGLAVAATGAAITEAEGFRLLEVGDKRFALQDFKGRYLSAAPTGPTGQIATAALAGAGEYFRFVEVDE